MQLVAFSFLGGEGRLSYSKNKLKAVGISLPQFLNIFEYFWHWLKGLFKSQVSAHLHMSLPLNQISRCLCQTLDLRASPIPRAAVLLQSYLSCLLSRFR